MVTRVLRLSKLQIKAVFAGLGLSVPPEDKALTPHEFHQLVLADLLENLKFLKPEARTIILNSVWETKTNGPADPDAAPCCVGDQVFFADSQYCTWLGYTGWLDLSTGDTISILPHAPVETIAYNLVELRRQATVAIENRSKSNAKRDARSMEEQGYVRVGSTDPISGQVRDGGDDVGPGDDSARS